MGRRMITEEDIRQRLRANLRALRIAASLTVKEAAARAKMNMRHWQKIESGEVNVTLQTLSRLAAAFGCDPADLIAEPAPIAPLSSDPK